MGKMLKINVDNIGDSRWCEFQPNVDFKIRPLSVSKRSQLERAATTRKNGRDEIDSDKLERLLRNHVIEDWRGVVDQNDQPIPCDEKHRDLIMDNFHNLRRFCMDMSVSLYEDAEMAAEKNGDAS